MKRQPTWDKYEVALLVEAYLAIERDKTKKLDVLQELSNNYINTLYNSIASLFFFLKTLLLHIQETEKNCQRDDMNSATELR